jgi:hypothetical protein
VKRDGRIGLRNADTRLSSSEVKQMVRIRKQEYRTRSELLGEAWRVYFESRYPVCTPTKAERTAINKGRAEFKRGEYVTLAEVHDELAIVRL